eukprot:5477665-Lingulodinium_polyedra.AAC.1
MERGPVHPLPKRDLVSDFVKNGLEIPGGDVSAMHGGGGLRPAHVAGFGDGAFQGFWCLGYGSVDAAYQMPLARDALA